MTPPLALAPRGALEEAATRPRSNAREKGLDLPSLEA